LAWPVPRRRSLRLPLRPQRRRRWPPRRPREWPRLSAASMPWSFDSARRTAARGTLDPTRSRTGQLGRTS